jgi:hypothetical protein
VQRRSVLYSVIVTNYPIGGSPKNQKALLSEQGLLERTPFAYYINDFANGISRL